MIPLEQQTTTLETSRRLKSLNCPQESLFYWVRAKFKSGDILWERVQSLQTFIESKSELIKDGKSSEIVCSAYTASEVGVWLPEYIGDDPEEQYALVISVGASGAWVVMYRWDNPIECMGSLAEAMGLMLIYLLENKIICIEDLKG